jgi:hypothetical protein
VLPQALATRARALSRTVIRYTTSDAAGARASSQSAL